MSDFMLTDLNINKNKLVSFNVFLNCMQGCFLRLLYQFLINFRICVGVFYHFLFLGGLHRFLAVFGVGEIPLMFY